MPDDQRETPRPSATPGQRPDDPPQPGGPFEEPPSGTSTSNESSTQDSGSDP